MGVLITVGFVCSFLFGFAFGEVSGYEQAREERFKELHEKIFGKGKD